MDDTGPEVEDSEVGEEEEEEEAEAEEVNINSHTMNVNGCDDTGPDLAVLVEVVEQRVVALGEDGAADGRQPREDVTGRRAVLPARHPGPATYCSPRHRHGVTF